MLNMQDINKKWMTDQIMKAWLILFEETLKSKDLISKKQIEDLQS